MTINERYNQIKQLKELATQFINENKQIKDTKHSTWEKKTAERNIEALKRRIKYLNQIQKPSLVEKYVESVNNPIGIAEIAEVTFQDNGIGNAISICQYSPNSNVIHDVIWIDRITEDDIIQIAMNQTISGVIEKYYEEAISNVKEKTIQNLMRNENYKEDVELIENAINLSRKESFIASNILLITAIESIVRKIGLYVYKKQNPELDSTSIEVYIYETFMSLEGLILKGNWKDDIFVTDTEIEIKYGNILDPRISEHEEEIMSQRFEFISLNRELLHLSSELGKDVTETTKTVLNEEITSRLLNTIKLLEPAIEIKNKITDRIYEKNHKIDFSILFNFLARRYKEDRNKIIHGKYSEYNSKYKNTIYLYALQEVERIFLKYHILYDSDR